MSDEQPQFEFVEVFNLSDPRNRMVFDVASAIHQDEWLLAGKLYGDYVRRSKDKDYVDQQTKEGVEQLVVELLHWCLNNDRYALAARLLWTEALFDPRPHFTQMIWDDLKKSAATMLMGSASASKSYSTGVWLVLDWLRDPENTCVKVLGPSEKHLSENLFTHLVNLHENASIKLPGETGDLWIGLDRRNKFSSISGVIVPLGRKAAGRLQGTKKGRRKKPHPVFGVERRLRVFLDESEKIPTGIWKDVDNIFSNMEGIENFKIICAFNPENQNGESGTRCEPPGGWLTFNPDRDERWISKRGWSVVRLDQMKNENILHKRIIFPGLQTLTTLNKVIENAGGYDSPGYYTMVRAMFPAAGALLHVIHQALADSMLGTPIWFGNPKPCLGVDLALEGGDAAKAALGEYGLASGYRTIPTKEFPFGQEILFTDTGGNTIFRKCLLVVQIFKLDRGNTVEMANQIIDFCKKTGVQGMWVALDRTGNGQGVYDTIRDKWSIDVTGINFYEGATESKIIEEDEKTAKEEYDRACSELWFAMKKYGEFKLMFISPLIDRQELFAQLTGRQYDPKKINRVETKKAYKDRNAGKSPDEADAVSLVLAAVRKASGDIPSMRTSVGINPHTGQENERGDRPGQAIVDITNRAPAGLDD